MKSDFLLEIGIEEMPARFLTPALNELESKCTRLLDEKRLTFDAIKTLGTPRRLTVLVKGLVAAQEPLTVEVKGPPRKAAFDIEGSPTKAGAGFARGQGVDPADLVTRLIGQVEYVFAVKQDKGLAAMAVLGEICPQLIGGMSFPKPMRWGYYDFKFARPIRWLTALYGEEVIRFEIAGVSSDRFTYGHRFLSSGMIELSVAGDYAEVLERNYVMVDPVRRREVIWTQVQDAATAEGGRVEENPDLLQEVVNILEYPTAFCGRFPEDYLALPEPVLVTPMREHQRYFPVRGKDGSLIARFVAVRNGTTEHLDTVRAGNEKVLRARLSDAAFFFREDLESPLSDRVEDLKKIVFREELGSVHEKVERIVALGAVISGMLDASDEARRRVNRAGTLSKADLVTDMVYEFPELQGVMGREYALRSGEEPEVAEAILEHYLPRGAGDVMPSTIPGRILAIADRIDNLVGAFGLGNHPTGSADPYALRRQALAICLISLDSPLYLNLSELFAKAHALYGARLKVGLGEVIDGLNEFFRQRLRGVFQERGLRYDVVDAVLALPFGDVRDLWERASAVAAFREREAFPDIYTAFTRAYNLAKNADPSALVWPERFMDQAEGALYTESRRVQEKVQAALKGRHYPDALDALAELRAPVDVFFDAVLVMVEDQDVRENRLALLNSVAEQVQKVADISKLVV
ncbi:MAG: glycine--tRNA ligase subunit beta [Eubacteriales bacterium]|nr:glycine--tRNA ligase subunit beta [Bacillota bacterium]MBV1726795.1 glycine--tRNA ligase subunit beta [Desulforudis sp.]MDZ4043007.1 glycine--tRNA ligase subunit beta [Eubacteriales bacterium]MBU4554258.1 glycine--tRNA ligase subunit beta [Bacillota bacterium]MBV1735806.1 glycine--tRNA ligase subunit beta [Desulforudis sp.]